MRRKRGIKLEGKENKMLKKICGQHGDVVWEEVDSIPDGAKSLGVKKGFVLERGEGIHTHVLEDIDGVEIFEKDGDIFVRVKEKLTHNHEEHGLQVLRPKTKIIKKRIERVFDYEAMEERKVID